MSDTLKNIIALLALIAVGIGFYSVFVNSPEQKVKRIAVDYYEAMMDQDDEEAYELLYKYDEKTPTEGTALTEKEAKSFYLEKINKLKEYRYTLKDYDIINIRKEDGHTSFAEVTLTFEVDGEEHEASETIDEWNGKVWIVESEDPFVDFRNGKMGFDLENAEPEFYFMD